MQVSIIIPIYKVEQYIKRCIQSVIMQTFTDYEVILVDDASPDNALAIAETLLIENNSTFQIIKHQQNKGLSEARNSGIKTARGKYIYFLDSDDELASKNTLQLLYAEIEKGHFDFVTAQEQHIENGKIKFKTTSPKKVEILEGTEILKALSKRNITTTAWNNLIRKEFILKNNLWFAKGYYFEDILYSFILCAIATRVAILPKVTYVYYLNENSNAITATLTPKKIEDAVFMCSEMLRFAKEKKINKKIDNQYIHNILRLAMLWILTHPSLLKDKTNWGTSYLLFQKMYRNSFLVEWKNKLFLPKTIAHFVIKYRYKGFGFKGQGLILEFLEKIVKLNF